MDKNKKIFENISKEMNEAKNNGTLTHELKEKYQTRVNNLLFHDIDSSEPIDENFDTKKETYVDTSFFLRKKFLSIP